MLMMICLTTSVGALRLNEILEIWHYICSPNGNGHLLDQSLVESHLEGIPGLGTLTTGGLAGGDLELLGWQTDGALDAEILALGALDELLADLLESGDLSAGQGDADLVSFLWRNVSRCRGTKGQNFADRELKLLRWAQTYWAFAKLFIRLLVRHFCLYPSRLERFCCGKVMKVIDCVM